MEILTNLLDYFSYLETHMDTLFFNHGKMTYFILFLVIFSETAFVVTPFLPGDSLLLATGALAASGSLDIMSLLLILTLAAFLGNICNYWIGYSIGKKAFHNEESKVFNQQNLLKAHRFYEKYGGLTIIGSRFIPFVRAFAPFVSGIAKMDFFHFLIYNFLGGFLWVFIFCIAGMFFGRIQFLQENTLFTITVLFIITLIFLPFIPVIWKIVKNRIK